MTERSAKLVHSSGKQEAFPAQLRQAGHAVHVPDLYEGQTFENPKVGLAYASQTGFDTLMDRGVAAVDDYGTALAYYAVSRLG